MQLHIRNIHFHLGGALASALVAASLAANDESSSSPEKAAVAASPSNLLQPPPIGSYWQGQGGIYLGLGRSGDARPDPHVILAIAPCSVFKSRSLGTYGVDVVGAASDYDGLANTIALAAAGSELCKEILEIEIDGHKDFGLMSRQDARLAIANAPELFEKEWHLTSTQYSSGDAWSQYFGYGSQSSDDKKFEAHARLVRRLFL